MCIHDWGFWFKVAKMIPRYPEMEALKDPPRLGTFTFGERMNGDRDVRPTSVPDAHREGAAGAWLA